MPLINLSPPVQNGRRFAEDIFKRIFLKSNLLYLNANFIEIYSPGSN